MQIMAVAKAIPADEAVQVTKENILEVAKWCNGQPEIRVDLLTSTHYPEKGRWIHFKLCEKDSPVLVPGVIDPIGWK